MISDATFYGRLADSHAAANAAAVWLKSIGIPARIMPIEVRPHVSQRYEYGDSGDIEITQIVESKRRTFTFSGREDYPFKSILIDEAWKIDAKPPNVFCYVITSADLKTAAVVPYSTRKEWWTEECYDRTAKHKIVNYYCHLNAAKFVQLWRQ